MKKQGWSSLGVDSAPVSRWLRRGSQGFTVLHDVGPRAKGPEVK